MRVPAAIVGLIAALSLGACNREPSFDERYATAEKAIHKKAVEMDAELAEAERQASEAASDPAPASQATSSMNAAK